MSRLGRALVIALALIATQATAKRSAQPGFAEPSDIIAAEGNFAHLSAAKGVKAAIRGTAAPDAQIFAPLLMQVSNYINGPAAANHPAQWHTRQVWMSCDGSIAVTYGAGQQAPLASWDVTIWRRQKGSSYKWVLEQGGALQAAPPRSDMIAASVADCPARHARPSATTNTVVIPTSDHGKSRAADYSSGQSEDATLAWSTTLTPDGGRSFALLVKQDGTMQEVLRAIAAPAGA